MSVLRLPPWIVVSCQLWFAIYPANNAVCWSGVGLCDPEKWWGTAHFPFGGRAFDLLTPVPCLLQCSNITCLCNIYIQKSLLLFLLQIVKLRLVHNSQTELSFSALFCSGLSPCSLHMLGKNNLWMYLLVCDKSVHLSAMVPKFIIYLCPCMDYPSWIYQEFAYFRLVGSQWKLTLATIYNGIMTIWSILRHSRWGT